MPSSATAVACLALVFFALATPACVMLASHEREVGVWLLLAACLATLVAGILLHALALE